MPMPRIRSVVAICTRTTQSCSAIPELSRTLAASSSGFLRPWNEVPALMGSVPPATPPATGTGVVTFLMG